MSAELAPIYNPTPVGAHWEPWQINRSIAESALPPSCREVINARISWLWAEYVSVFPKANWMELLYGRYGIRQPKLATLEELTDLINHFRSVLLTVPRR
jgi:hypothetical protein